MLPLETSGQQGICSPRRTAVTSVVRESLCARDGEPGHRPSEYGVGKQACWHSERPRLGGRG